MKNMKKLLAILLIGAMAISIAACGSKKNETTEVANPFTETDAKGLAAKTGIEILAPEGATDVTYSYCDAGDNNGIFGQVVFTLDGTEYTYRAMSTSLTELGAGEGSDADIEGLMSSLKDGTNEGAMLAGMYYDWKAGGQTEVSGRTAVYGLIEGKQGFISWLDVVPGILYSLSVDKGATQDKLTETAEKIFVPLQGEVG